jgi:hypothetical protein
VLLRAERLAKASDKVAFLLSLAAAVFLLISGLALNLPNRPGRTALLASSLLVER